MNKNAIRHETLRILSDKAFKVMYDTTENIKYKAFEEVIINTPLPHFLNVLGITESEFRRANVTTVYFKEMYYIEHNSIECLSITSLGVMAYEDRKYPILQWAKITDIVTKWILPIISLGIALGALAVSILRNYQILGALKYK